VAQEPDDPHRESEALRLLVDCLELPEAERGAWLEKHCGGDVDLRLRVEALLDAERASTGFLEQPHAGPIGSDRAGQRVGAFILESPLARGGMSSVYRARRVDGGFDQAVAVKVFDAAHLPDSARARFDAERRILAALDHPGIARVIDGGSLDDGTPYLVMELVRGQPITRWCNERELNVTARLNLFRQVCEALDEAHRRGVVHRDLKPGNVLVNESGQPKLIDFGIARVLDPAALNVEMPETRAGSGWMTPEYASPEQIRGAPTGVASDVYSLGVLLYQLLTGTRPHSLAGLGPAEIDRVVSGTIPPDPSARVRARDSTAGIGDGSARQLSRQLRGDLDRIVMTAMRVAPEQRYSGPLALAEDLERFLDGRPVRARGASRLYRAGRFVSRHRIGVAATAAAFLALAGASGTAWRQAVEAREQRDLARTEAQRAESARDFLVEMIGRADPFENADAPTLAGSLKLALPGLEARFAGQPKLESDLRYAIGYALQNLGEIDPARTQLERALKLRDQHGDAVDRAEAHDGLAIVAWWESDFESGDDHFGRALELLHDLDSERAQVLRVNVLANWSAMLIDAGDNERSEALSLEALERVGRTSGVSDETLAAIWSNIATARDGLGRPEEALAAFEMTMEIQRRATGEMHPSFAIVLNNLALMYYGMDRLDDAVDAMRRSVEIRRATLGPRHPQTATALFNLARLLTVSGQMEAAETHAREALQVATGGYEPGHPRIGKAHEALAIVLDARGAFDDALRHARIASEIYSAAPGVDPAWQQAATALIERIGQAAAAEAD